MTKNEIINKTQDFIKNKFENETSGHDWWHIHRVWKTAAYIAKQESADSFVVELAALLHDIADWKMHDGDMDVSPKAAKEWLTGLEVDEDIIDSVCDIIFNLSFKGAGVKQTITTLEGKIVQDADRLDAIGAIGIARAFTFGGAFGQLIYHPEASPQYHTTFEEYKNNHSTTVNHFYEKLLLLKDRMHTETAKKIATERHLVMEKFLADLKTEWGAFSD